MDIGRKKYINGKKIKKAKFYARRVSTDVLTGDNKNTWTNV